MFNQLLESKKKRQRSVGGTMLSVVLHTALISGAAYATAHAGLANNKQVEETAKYVEIKKEEPPPPKKETPPPPDAPVTPPPPKGFLTLTPPIKIPDVIPPVDLTHKVTNEADFSGVGKRGGVANGVVGGTGPVDQETPYSAQQVDRQVEPLEGNDPPKYPSVLQSAGIEGAVETQFVVDTTGTADMVTFKVLNSGEVNPLFVNSVKSALEKMRFRSAEINGHKVRQLVQQAFNFNIKR